MDRTRNYIPGCTYIVRNKETFEEMLATGNFCCIDITYEYKPKWQFWKRKKIGYYTMMCIKSLSALSADDCKKFSRLI